MNPAPPVPPAPPAPPALLLASPDPPVPAPATVLGGETQTQTEMQAQTHRAFFVVQLVRVACELGVRSPADVEAAMLEGGVP